MTSTFSYPVGYPDGEVEYFYSTRNTPGFQHVVEGDNTSLLTTTN